MDGEAGLPQCPRHGVAGIQAGGVLPVQPIQGAPIGVEAEQAQAGRGGVNSGGQVPIRKAGCGSGSGVDRANCRAIGLHRGASLYRFAADVGELGQVRFLIAKAIKKNEPGK